MKEFLKEIGIDKPGRYTDDEEYVVDIADSNEYSKIYSLIDNNDHIHELEDDSVFDVEKNELYYEAKDYELELDADLEKDIYKLIVRKKEED